MEQTQTSTIAVLERTPAALDALLRGLPDEWTRSNEGEGTWSAFDVVVHLTHCEHDDWVRRAQMILETPAGEVREFPPFDRWGEIRESQQKSMVEVLEEFAAAREQSLRTLRGWEIGPEQMAMRGRHPKLGEVTLSALLATWAAHDLNHLHQISRVMAYQYREAVGSFAQYLGVMQCNGHGG